MKLRTSVGFAAAALALACAGSASAATLAVNGTKSCYRTGDKLTLTGSGFSRGGLVEVSLDQRFLGTVRADAAGNFSAPLEVGPLEGVAKHTVRAVDATNPTVAGTASFLGAELAVELRPRNGASGRVLRVRATGFTTGDRLYAHLTRRGRTRNLLVGPLKGPCHTAKLKRRLLPAWLHTGVYRVQFDTRRHLSRETKVRVRFRLTVSG